VLGFVVSPTGRAADSKLTANAILQFEFPAAFPQPAVIAAQLPSNYTAEKKYPVFVYCSGAENRLELARAAAGAKDCITVCPPLPSAALETKALADLYRTMLEKLFEAVPNASPEGGTLGGYGQGADTVADLLASRDEFTLQHFGSFYLFDGGAKGLATILSSSVPFVKPVRVLVLRGDAGKPSPAREALDQLLSGKTTPSTPTGFKVSSLVMRGYDGRVELPQYLGCIGLWAHGMQMPPTMLVQSRGEILKAFTARSYTDAEGHVLLYRLFIPAGYEPGKKYPLTLFLHGSGEAGDNNETQAVGAAAAALSHPFIQAKYPSFVVCPQIPRRAQWGFGLSDNWPPQALFGLLETLRKEFSLDGDRLYITGLSLGGFGTWDMIGRYPDMFAAAVPVSAAGDPTQVEKFKNLPIWALHGTVDRAVIFAGPMPKNKGLIPGIVGDSDMIAALEKAGGHPKFTVYEGQGHGIWPLAYNETGLYDWLFSQKRSRPAETPDK